MIALLALAALLQTHEAARPIVVASKPFGESYLLAEMFAQLLETRGFRVERKLGLGATELAFGALRASEIDVYPEYTGTGLLVLLKDTTRRSAQQAYAEAARAFPERFGVHWLPPLGFENTYAIAVRRETAQRFRLATLSDLARAAPRLSAGLSPDFLGRSDGLPGLASAYGLRFREVRPLLQGIKYRALAEGSVDVVDGYSTDGLLARYDLVVLRDDRGFFPPYEAAGLVSARLYDQQPAAVAALTALSGRINVARMRAWNERAEVKGDERAAIARDALEELGLRARTTRSAQVDDRANGSLLGYLVARRGAIGLLTLRHLLLVGVCTIAAVIFALPLGLWLERVRSGELVIRAVGLLQTIPGIALLAFMIPLFGIGLWPALVALFLYSLYPILRNTYTGLRSADPSAVQAGRALGMTPVQVLLQVRLPLAAPVIMAGIRTAAVIAVGTATLAAFIGAGGLGDPIVSGLALSDTRMILQGAIPAAMLALVMDFLLGRVERALTPVFQSAGSIAQ